MFVDAGLDPLAALGMELFAVAALAFACTDLWAGDHGSAPGCDGLDDFDGQ
jgi:hypothetical protein